MVILLKRKKKLILKKKKEKKEKEKLVLRYENIAICEMYELINYFYIISMLSFKK